jgi:hypothetical protein
MVSTIGPRIIQFCILSSIAPRQGIDDRSGWFKASPYGTIAEVTASEPGGKWMKRVELTVGDKTIGGTLVDFETIREEYNSYKLSDGSLIRMKTVVTNIIRTDEFTPNGEPIYIVNSQNVLVADVPDDLKKAAKIQ